MKLFGVMVAITCSLAGNAPIQARSSDDARLIVNRSANFGVNESINLAIDGVPVAVLGVNQKYDVALPPGKHVLFITTNPSRGRPTLSPRFGTTPNALP